MKRQILLCVEIPDRRPFQGSPVASPSSALDPPTKKRKLGPPNSPTVSDFDDVINILRSSPTVSDFLNEPSETLAPSEDGSTASSSNITLDNLKLVESLNLYEVPTDEIPEEDVLLRETLPEDLGENSNDIPIRVLDDFVVFDLSTKELVPIAQLCDLEHSSARTFSASGVVRVWTGEEGDGESDEDDEDSEDRSFRTKLSTILELNVHSISEETGDLDSKIYLRTIHAWYILSVPSQQYQPFYAPFWIQHQVLHTLASLALKNPRTTYDEFLDSFSDVQGDRFTREGAVASIHILGRVLNEADIQSDDVKAYLIGLFPSICEDYGLSIHKVNLATEYLELNLDEYAPPRNSTKSKPRLRKTVSSDEEQEVLKHKNSTFITPIVSQIMRNLFSVPLDVAETPEIEDDMDIVAKIDELVTHHENPASMKWGKEEDGVYLSIIMDGVEYRAGDDVMVNPGKDENATAARISKTDASQSQNTYANRLWFCKICYFFEEVVDGKKTKMFHGQWFIHGSKTILQETAHSKSLFLMEMCDNNPVAAIFQKCNIKWLKPGEKEQPDNGAPNSNEFHCSMVYDEKDAHFVDLPPDDELSSLLGGEKPCLSCALRDQKEQLEVPSVNADGFSHHGIQYHARDFVYVRPSKGTAGLLDIGQIIKIKATFDELKVTVQFLERYEKQYCSRHREPWDERRLYLTEHKHTVDHSRLEGICRVKHLTKADEIDKWVHHDNHFYVNQRLDDTSDRLCDLENGTLLQCDSCRKELLRKQQEEDKLLTRNGRIRCLELFSGAGGLGTGLDLSGFIETKYAVEFSPSAAATYAKNHPHAIVYCQDSNNLLKQAYDISKGENPQLLKSGIDGTLLPRMPKRGEVDMISGGPPCQSFSMANHNPRPDDIRSTLPGNMLSYVELYDPQYFLLENVVGLLTYRLMSTRSTTKRSLIGGIEAGMVKFIMRTLIALGYQVKCKVLQAGQYGAPQSRRRTIFWGAKRGVTIPDHPLPMYAFEKGMNRFGLPTFTMEPVSRNPDDNHQCAPLPAVTINDAIGDLPPFDWINPHQVIPATKKDKETVKQRIAQDIAQFAAVSGQKDTPPAGFIYNADYHTEPQNRYQKWLRRDMEEDEGVQAHYTKCFTSKVVEATTSIPLMPKATHRDIPLKLLSDSFRKPEKNRHSYYGRLDGDSQFRCAMTSVAPNSKESWILHPNQKRVLSIREMARSQGFPDHYIFVSLDKSHTKTVANQIRQIGNAVPVPLALHLGKALGKALLKDLAKEHEMKERESSPVV